MRFLLFAVLLLSLTSFRAQVTFLGFDTVICGNPLSSSHTYSSYSSGSGSGTCWGYQIFLNGTPVYTQCGVGSSGYSCKDLYFIDDSIGFLVDRIGMGTSTMRRTTDGGFTWQSMGSGGAPNYLGMYIVNQNYGYVASWYQNSGNPPFIVFTKCAIAASEQNGNFIFDTQCNQDLYKNDTLYSNPLCPKDSLKATFATATDTFTYYINYHLIPTSIKPEASNIRAISIFPNPVELSFGFNENTSAINSVKIFSLSGQEVKSFTDDEINSNSFSADGLSAGLYVLKYSGKHINGSLKFAVK